MNDIRKFPTAINKELKYYIYLLSNPIDSKVFYVGKGKGNRVFQHLKDSNLNEKTKTIKELQAKGLKPKIEILVHGINDEFTAKKVESAIIDLMGKDNLTNAVGGYESAEFGRMDLNQIFAKYQSEKANIEEPVLLLKIKQTFRYNMPENELYDYTRGIWILNKKNREKVDYAFCVYDNIIQETYKVVKWFPAGSTYHAREDKDSWKKIIRWEFVGNISQSMRKKYQYKSVEHHYPLKASNPVRYVNVD